MVVTRKPANVIKKRRHPAKTCMLIAVALWPVLIMGGCVGMAALSVSGMEHQRDGQYYYHVDGLGWQQTSLGMVIVESAACSATGSTILFAGVMTILWTVWFATKD